MNTLAFDPADPRAALGALPEQAAVFALYGAEAKDEPYVGRTPNLRMRLKRLLTPSEKHPRRLQLAGRVRRIEWRLSGSEFESLLVQFSLLDEVFGAEKALERMHLRAPVFVRYMGGNRYPRLSVTTRPGQRESGWAYGPFASRAAADRFVDEALKLFLLRRCVEDLEPDPRHPGCVYSEMKMCLAPCFGGCSDERYAEEAEHVEQFLATRGESRLVELRAARDRASEGLEFEEAAAAHAQVLRVESIAALAPELVQPLNRLRALLLEASAEPGEVTVFLFEEGELRGPAGFSTLGMRIQNEQSGSSSLFAQPVALEAVPEEKGREQTTENREQTTENRAQRAESREQSTENSEQGTESREQRAERTERGAECGAQSADLSAPGRERQKVAKGLLEARFDEVLRRLLAAPAAGSPAQRQAHLALLKRWYYRPEAKRAGEIFFPAADGSWPVKAILRGIGRVAARTLGAAS